MAKLFHRRARRVLIDVDTQYDLIFGNDRDNSEVLANIRRLFAWARVHHMPVVSTALTSRSDAVPDKTTDFKQICIEGTPGQKKIRYTMLSSNILFGPENRMDLPRHLLRDFQQIIFEKRTFDPFDQPRIDRMLSELKCDEFIVFGVGVSTSIKCTALGLLRRGKRVLLVQDAIDYGLTGESSLAIRKIEAKGAKLIKTNSITGPSRLKGKAGHDNPWHTPVLTPARVC